jgi:hypothetical protein
MPSKNDARRGIEKWLVRHAKELDLPSVPKGLKSAGPETSDLYVKLYYVARFCNNDGRIVGQKA